MKTLILLLLLLVSGCGGSPQLHRTASSSTASFITKGAMVTTQPTGMEATPIVWNGELLYVIDGTDAAGVHTKIMRQSDHTLLADNITGLYFVSAIVSNNTLYIFGSNGNEIDMISTTDLANWTTKQTVFVAPTKVFNTSVTASPIGFVMTYEACAEVCFNASFLQSPDLIHWSAIGTTYEKNYFTACPTIRYVDGYYYLFFVSSFNGSNATNYATTISRSHDLLNWTFSPITVIWPDEGDSQGNASDMDLVEFNGQVRIIYSNESQNSVFDSSSGLREASFDGSFSEFVVKFFNQL